MYNMRTATMRQVRHELTEVLSWVAAGEEVTVLNRNRPVARILPPRPAVGAAVAMPDFAGRVRANFGERVISNLVIEERERSRW